MRKFLGVLLFLIPTLAMGQMISLNEENQEIQIASYEQIVPMSMGRVAVYCNIQEQDSVYMIKLWWNMQDAGQGSDVPIIVIGKSRKEAISVLQNWIDVLNQKKKGTYNVGNDYRFQYVGNNKWFRVLPKNSDRVCAVVRKESLIYLKNKIQKES